MQLFVPRFKQQKNTCGATALRMILAYYGKQVSDADIIKACGGLKAYGLKTSSLATYANNLGYATECLSFNAKMAQGKATIKRPTLKDIDKWLKKGVPVMLAVRSAVLYGEQPTNVGHFIVITGYKHRVYNYNDPWQGKACKIEAEHLQLAWFPNTLDSSAYLLVVWLQKGSHRPDHIGK